MSFGYKHQIISNLIAFSIEGEEIELLSLLIENYERENYRMEAPSPLEAIKFRMEQMGLKQNVNTFEQIPWNTFGIVE